LQIGPPRLVKIKRRPEGRRFLSRRAPYSKSALTLPKEVGATAAPVTRTDTSSTPTA